LGLVAKVQTLEGENRLSSLSPGDVVVKSRVRRGGTRHESKQSCTIQQQQMSEWLWLVTGLFAACRFLKLIPTLEPVNRDEKNHFGNLIISAYNF